MNFLLAAAVAAADGIVYDLATRLFEGKKTSQPAIMLTHSPQCAELIALLSLIVISAALIWARITSRIPRIFSTCFTISLLSCVAIVAWCVILHTPDFISAGAHASLTVFELAKQNLPHII